MKEKDKANELFEKAVKLHGEDKAKEESLKSAQATYELAPFTSIGGTNKDYWQRVIQHLEKK